MIKISIFKNNTWFKEKLSAKNIKLYLKLVKDHLVMSIKLNIE